METGTLASAPMGQKSSNLTIIKIANGYTISFGYGNENQYFFPTIEDAMDKAKEYFA